MPSEWIPSGKIRFHKTGPALIGSDTMTKRISTHFTWREATHSDTAERMGLSNAPTAEAKEAITLTADALEGVRCLLGSKPLIITSWYRSPEVNAAVGGSKTSDHITGYAVDFRATGMNAYQAARRIEASPLMFDQLIWYPGEDRLHISFAPALRREVMTARKASTYTEGLDG